MSGINTREAVYANESYTVAVRRHLHINAETSGNEVKTTEYIKGEFEKMGIEAKEVEHGGLIAILEGARPGKSIICRADCDALPMSESDCNLKGPRLCKSENPDAMHACGHDGHVAMAMTAAKVLAENKDKWAGRVIFAIERGEENGWGAVQMLDALRGLGPIDGCYGNHLYCELPTGKISVEPGSRMAAGAGGMIKLTGRGGHGSRPDLCVNPLDAFVDIYASCKELLAVKLNPFSPVTFTVGAVTYGTVGNIIPDDLTFFAGFRFADFTKSGKATVEGLRKIVETCCEKHGVTYEMSLRALDMAVINNPDCSAIAEAAITKALGPEYVGYHEPWLASEDFGMYLKYWPGVFAFVGIQNEEFGSGAPHHNTNFDIDEAALSIGACGTLQYILDFLENDKPIRHTPETRTPEELMNAV
ncbi:MAG TPA: amidohydrolase [Candidatus Acidoferrum sp.]|nr:amidohydrolase [Candidatus Acidoferrum sp.]